MAISNLPALTGLTMGSLTSPVESGRSQEPIGLLISGALILREHESATCNRACRQIHFTDFIRFHQISSDLIRFLCLRIGWWEVLHEPPRELTVDTVVSCRFFMFFPTKPIHWWISIGARGSESCQDWLPRLPLRKSSRYTEDFTFFLGVETHQTKKADS